MPPQPDDPEPTEEFRPGHQGGEHGNEVFRRDPGMNRARGAYDRADGGRTADDAGWQRPLTVAAVSTLISSIMVITLPGWYLRGWVDEIENLAIRIEQVDAAAVQRGITFAAEIAALRAELALLEEALGRHAAAATNGERTLDRRLTLVEERQQRVLRTLDYLLDRRGLPPLTGPGNEGWTGDVGPP
jgi:hypothetical protein